MLVFGFLIAPLLVILPLSFNAEPYFTFTEGALCSTLMPFRNLIMGLLISPMIVPLIITAAGIFFFYASLNEFAQLTGSFIGIVLAHTVLGTPFVVITVTATLIGFDRSLVRAGLVCGATPTRVFFKVVLSLILPGGDLGRPLRLRHLLRRDRRGPLRRERRVPDHPAADVGRHSRRDQPDHPRGGDPADLPVHLAHDRGRDAAPL